MFIRNMLTWAHCAVLSFPLTFLCLALPVASFGQPQAELRLEEPHLKRAYNEAFQYTLTLTNIGEHPIPVLRDISVLSTTQLFLVTKILETRPVDRLSDLEPGGSLPQAEPPEATDWNRGGVETVNWQEITQRDTRLLQPGESIAFTDPPLFLHDRIYVDPRATKFTWQFWFLIGDGVWAKSNVLTFEMVDREVKKDGVIVRYLPPVKSTLDGQAQQGIPVYRLVVEDEQWIYLQHRRIATLPVDLEPEYYREPGTARYWLRFPGKPELNLQSSSERPYLSVPERTPPKPEFLVPAPDEPGSGL